MPGPPPRTPAPNVLAPSPRTRPDEALASLARIVIGERSLGEVLQQVTELAAKCVPGASEVSVTLVDGGVARTAAFTGSLAALLDERQYDDGFGPCMEAARTGGVVQVPDTSSEGRFTAFAAAARRHGIRSTLSVGMPLPQRVVGAINIYRTGPEDFDDDSVALARVFADYAAVALANAVLYSSTAELAEQMQRAMASRAVIEQAKGVLVARSGITPDEAFDELSRRSQHENRKLRDIAADVIEEASRRI